jgi:hypothetical protein
VALFVRAVGEHAVVEYGRLHTGRHQQGTGYDEAVDQQHFAQFGRLQHGASHHGDF